MIKRNKDEDRQTIQRSKETKMKTYRQYNDQKKQR